MRCGEQKREKVMEKEMVEKEKGEEEEKEMAEAVSLL